MLGRNGIGNAATLWLAVIMKLSRRTCMTSTCLVECGALVDVSVAHLRVAVAKQLYSVERDTDRTLERTGVFGARSGLRGVNTDGFNI